MQVKLISQNGERISLLEGHERTPWAVAFCPHSPSLIATGDLGCQLRLWSTITGRELASRSLRNPISSIAFHPVRNLLLAAAGEKIFGWSFRSCISTPDEAAGHDDDSTSLVNFYTTDKSIRAVRFHCSGLKLLLTAEVLGSSNHRDVVAFRCLNNAIYIFSLGGTEDHLEVFFRTIR